MTSRAEDEPVTPVLPSTKKFIDPHKSPTIKEAPSAEKKRHSTIVVEQLEPEPEKIISVKHLKVQTMEGKEKNISTLRGLREKKDDLKEES
jgi:hypothetical protein